MAAVVVPVPPCTIDKALVKYRFVNVGEVEAVKVAALVVVETVIKLLAEVTL